MEQSEQLDYHIYKEYQVFGKVGKGTYGVVYKARHKKTSQIVAIKKIIDAFQNLIDAKRTYRELNYLLQMKHPCIVRLQYLINCNKKGIFNEPNTTRLTSPPFDLKERGSTTDKLFYKAPQEVKHVYAVFQFIQTDLQYALRTKTQIQPIQRKYIAYQLLHGIAYLHRSGLVHRDIKPSNILLNPSNLQIKICDFGMARLKVAEDSLNEGILTEYVASRWYRPPQGLLGITTCYDSIDLWSVGCVLAELVLKTPLFPGKSTLDQLQLILKCIGMPSSKQIQKLPSKQAQQILCKFTFSKRCKMNTLKQILNLCGNQQIDLIMNLLKFDPSMRMSAEDALKHQYFNDLKDMNLQVEKIQRYSKATTKILDFSLQAHRSHPQTRNSNSNPGVQHYRMLIEQLEKYADKSTNRSGNTFNRQQIHQNIQIADKFHDSLNDKLKQKSTKQSDYVTLNKHHYLKSTHSLIQDKHQYNQPQIPVEQTKTVADQVKPTKMKKRKNSSNEEVIQKPEMHNPIKKEFKKEKTSKKQVKQKKSITIAKKTQHQNENTNKKQSLHRNKSSKSIRQRNESLNDKKFFLCTQPIPANSKKKHDHSKSLAKSSSSFLRTKQKTPSKQKTFSKYNVDDDKKVKAQQLKKFMKPSLNLNKGPIMKIKSTKYINQTKKNP